jgi:hypothetical protein
MTTELSCPECGAPLDLVEDGWIGRAWFVAKTSQIETRLEQAPFAACTGCEFCITITLSKGTNP